VAIAFPEHKISKFSLKVRKYITTTILLTPGAETRRLGYEDPIPTTETVFSSQRAQHLVVMSINLRSKMRALPLRHIGVVLRHKSNCIPFAPKTSNTKKFICAFFNDIVMQNNNILWFESAAKGEDTDSGHQARVAYVWRALQCCIAYSLGRGRLLPCTDHKYRFLAHKKLSEITSEL